MSAEEASGEAGFRVLFDEHFADLWRFARRRVGSASDADDVVAETFATAWRRRDRMPGGRDARLWLFGVARYVVANRRRSDARRRRLHLRLAWQRDGAEGGVGWSEPDAGLSAALAALDDTAREVLIMRYWDGLAVQEIATLLDCTPNAASLRLHKAKRRLAGLLRVKDPAVARTDSGRSGRTEGPRT